MPTLVAHGLDDPLIASVHAETYAPMIPGAEVILIENMGHGVPRTASAGMVEAMLRLFMRAERQVERSGD